MNPRQVKFICESGQGEISGRTKQTVFKGDTTTTVKVSAKTGYRFIQWSTGETSEEIQITPTEDTTVYATFERIYSTLPTIIINTENNEMITSKEEYYNCIFEICNTEEKYSVENVEAKIRGRGNTSWDSPKKPYKLKLDKPMDLFGNGEANVWTLIANHTDLSLVRNYLAYSVASLFDSQQYTCKTRYVDLFLNEEYLGVYLLCEQIEVHPNRVDINDGFDIDTGYLIELDGREDGDGFYVNGKFYSIKSPNTEAKHYTDEHTKFIKSYLDGCIKALSSDDYSRVEELIDTKSFAQAYVVFELFNCVDVGYASFYLNKNAKGKLECGPVWDFDRSLGITGNQYGAEPYNALWAKNSNVWFNLLLKHEEFVSLVSKEIYEKSDKIIETINSCYGFVYSHEEAFLRNFEKWNILGEYVWPNSGPTAYIHTWEGQVEYTKTYICNSLNFLKNVYNKN